MDKKTDKTTKRLEIIKVLLSMGGSAGIYIASYLLIFSVLSGFFVSKGLSVMYLNATAMAGAAFATLCTIKKDEFGSLISRKLWLRLLLIALLAYASSAFFNVLLGCIPWEGIFGESVVPDEDAFFGIPLWARMICYELVAPVAEELLFRQVFYKRMRRFLPVFWAVIVSALLFGIYHGNLVQGIYAFLMGCFLALVYEWSGSILAPMLFHMVANHVSDVAYEVEAVSQVVYSLPFAAVSLVVIVAVTLILAGSHRKELLPSTKTPSEGK